MKRVVIFLLFVFVVLSRLVMADTELWSVDTFQWQVKDAIRLNVIPELRFKNNANEFYYLITYLGPTFKLTDNFDLNLFYAPKTTKSGGTWTSGSAGYLDLVYKNGGISNRSRLENDFTSGALTLRDQLQYKINGWYVGDEIFYSTAKGYLTRIGHRRDMLSGCSKTLNCHWDAYCAARKRRQRLTGQIRMFCQ